MIHDVQPGLYPDLSNAAYHGGPGLSKSLLDHANKCMAMFDFVVNSGEYERESTPTQEFGSAYHMIVLEPEKFYDEYVLELQRSDAPHAIEDRDVLVGMVAKLNEKRMAKLPVSGDKATQIARIIEAEQQMIDAGMIDSKDAYFEPELQTWKGAELKQHVEALNERRDGMLPISGTRHELAELLRANGVDVVLWSDVVDEWNKAHAHQKVLCDKDWQTLHEMRNALQKHPKARALLRLPGAVEQSFYWIDPVTGLLCRCRPDRRTDSGFLIDLKSTDDASKDGFRHSIQKWRYDVQHPFYFDGINLAIDQAGLDIERPREFFFIAQEKKKPYLVGVYRLSKDDVDLGRMEYQHNLLRVAESQATGVYPGYSDDIEEISLSQWHREQTALRVSATLH